MTLFVALVIGVVLIAVAGLFGEELFLWGGVIVLVATAFKALG